MAAFEKVTEMSYGKRCCKQFTIKRRVFGLSRGLQFPAEKPEGTPHTIGSLFKDSTDSYDGGIDCKRSRCIFRRVDKERGVSEGVLGGGKGVLHIRCPHQGCMDADNETRTPRLLAKNAMHRRRQLKVSDYSRD